MIRPYEPDDEAWVLRTNAANVPAVGPMDAEALAWYIARAPHVRVAHCDGVRAGFLIGFEQGSEYQSPNYRWFAAAYPRFAYVDRVVVVDAFQGRGIGRALYDDFVAWSGGRHPVLCAEVNTRPRNDGSLIFHERYGFVPVGGHSPYPEVEVALLVKELS